MFSRFQRKALSATIALACSSYQVFSGEIERQKQEKGEVREQKTKSEEQNATFSYHSLLRQVPLEETWRDIFLERLSFHSTNYLAPHNLIGLLNESIGQRITGEEVLGKPFWGEIKSSAKQALRETFVRRMRLDEILESIFPDAVGEKFYNMFRGRSEIGILNNPFDLSKGILGQELYDPARLPRHRTFEPRLLSTNPSLNWTLRTSPLVVGVHAYRAGADAVIEIPLTQSWVFANGIKIDDYSGERAFGYVGFSGFIKGGYVTVGTRMPLHDSVENRPLTVVSCAWQF